MPRAPRFLILPLLLASTAAVAFQHGVPYTFKTQAWLSEPGRADSGWYFAGDETGGVYPRTTALMREGGFSDLALDPSDATGHTFWTVQDRGLAVSYEDDESNDTAFKVFAFPGHHQKLLRVRVQGDSVETLARDSIGGLDTGFVTGLPSSRAATEEVALRMRLDSAAVSVSPSNRVPASPNGHDFEGLARAPDGTFYLADEMGPRVVRVDAASRRITREWKPDAGLPRVFARRRDNRGLESLCLTPAGKLAGLMQAGLNNTASGKRSHAKDSTRVLRFLLLDPANNAIKEHVYLADLKGGARAPGEVKIGAMTCLNDSSFLVVEHGEDDEGYDWIDLYRIDILPNTSDVHEANDATGNGRLFQGGLKTLEQVGYIPGDSANLTASGITPLRKVLVFGDVIGRTDWRHDTPEGLAYVNDSTIALINDNNYAQEDNDGDGIPHLTGVTKRLTQLMYLDLGAGFTTSLRERKGQSGLGGSRAVFRVVPATGGWRVSGPPGLTARLTEIRGRIIGTATAEAAGSLDISHGGRSGVFLLDLRHGRHREIRRLAR